MPISSQKAHTANVPIAAARRRSGASDAEKWDRSKVRKAAAANATEPTFAFRDIE
jgi:hypothetical protein